MNIIKIDHEKIKREIENFKKLEFESPILLMNEKTAKIFYLEASQTFNLSDNFYDYIASATYLNCKIVIVHWLKIGEVILR